MVITVQNYNAEKQYFTYPVYLMMARVYQTEVEFQSDNIESNSKRENHKERRLLPGKCFRNVNITMYMRSMFDQRNFAVHICRGKFHFYLRFSLGKCYGITLPKFYPITRAGVFDDIYSITSSLNNVLQRGSYTPRIFNSVTWNRCFIFLISKFIYVHIFPFSIFFFFFN